MPDHDPWASASEVRTSARWHSAAAKWGQALTEALLDAANLQQDSVVLDIAAGSGDPALSIAQRLTQGSVVALDPSSPGLLLAKRQAEDMGVGSRLRFVQADAERLPFPDSCFDRVTCRCGIMFFAELDAALGEIRRVLKPSGRVSFLAWGPFEQPFVESTVGVILRIVPGTTVPEAVQAAFKFARSGLLSAALQRNGFRSVEEQHLTLPRIWAGLPLELWQYFQEVGTLERPLLETIPGGLRPDVDRVACAALARFRTGDTITVPAQVVLASGVR
jgi:ubiquinone/menaquinone biosynthesis C-methylase UbiE